MGWRNNDMEMRRANERRRSVKSRSPPPRGHRRTTPISLPTYMRVMPFSNMKSGVIKPLLFLLLPFPSLHYTSPPEIESISVPGAMTKAHAKKREACPIGRKCPRVLRHYHVAVDDDDGVACKKEAPLPTSVLPEKVFIYSDRRVAYFYCDCFARISYFFSSRKI